METAESEAVIEQDAAVGDVEAGECDGVLFEEIFAEGQIPGSVARQISAGILRVGISIGESGAVVDVG